LKKTAKILKRGFISVIIGTMPKTTMKPFSAGKPRVNINDRFPTVRRNLALAYFNKKQDGQKALAELEAAFASDPTDARILFELDQLYKRLNQKPEQRLEMLEKHLSLVEDRDDLYLERVTLYNLVGTV
jgi:Tfp pilus assembly protein PilF